MRIEELTAVCFSAERLPDGVVRVFATGDAVAPLTEAKVKKVKSSPNGGLPEAPFVAFSVYLEFEPQFNQMSADVWIAGADWGPTGPLHIFRVGHIGPPGTPVLFQLVRN